MDPKTDEDMMLNFKWEEGFLVWEKLFSGIFLQLIKGTSLSLESDLWWWTYSEGGSYFVTLAYSLMLSSIILPGFSLSSPNHSLALI